MLELEVPELMDGTIEIVSIAREPGHRTKIAVKSNDPKVDPKGACVGARGARVRQVVNELRGEKVDVVEWREDIGQFIAEALGPAKVQQVNISEEDKIATVIVADHQLSLAIGKEGQNARLAARLSGYKVDIQSDQPAPVESFEAAPTEEPAPASVAPDDIVQAASEDLAPAGPGDTIKAASDDAVQASTDGDSEE
jgi:N utilization substance protein A